MGEDLSKLAGGLTDAQDLPRQPGRRAEPAVRHRPDRRGGPLRTPAVCATSCTTRSTAPGHPARQHLPAGLRRPTPTPPRPATSASSPSATARSARCRPTSTTHRRDPRRAGARPRCARHRCARRRLPAATDPCPGGRHPDRPAARRPAAELQGDDPGQGARRAGRSSSASACRATTASTCSTTRCPASGTPDGGAVRRSAGDPRQRSASTSSGRRPASSEGTIGFIALEATDNKPGARQQRRGPPRPGRARRARAAARPGRAVRRGADRRLLHRPDPRAPSCSPGDPSQYLTDATLQGGIDLDLKLETGHRLGRGHDQQDAADVPGRLPAELGVRVGTDSSTPTALPDPEIALEHISVNAGELFEETVRRRVQAPSARCSSRPRRSATSCSHRSR